MHTLRELADDGRTVVVVTHSVADLELCDQLLLLAPGGWIAYFGPPAGALRYFDRPDFAGIFLLLESRTGADGPTVPAVAGTSAGIAQPRLEQRSARAGRGGGEQVAGHGPVRPRCREQRSSPSSGCCADAIWRSLLPIASIDFPDRASAGAEPAGPGGAGLRRLVGVRAAATDDPQPQQLLLILIIGGCLMGSAASVRELVKERPIYRRERAIGLSIGAYLASKSSSCR